jgi:2-polyprenyl-3-methyl-5-hydroxy-6-metoxy-1,4-benzoquinol methylase
MQETLQDRNRWEAEYQCGRWNYLAGSDEFIRYAIINAFLLGRKVPLSLLDVGCGEGLLLKKLGPQFVSKYTGLDLAQSALDKIHPKRNGDEYVLSSVEDFIPAQKWDAIVFNEVLYYTADPVAQIKKFENALTPDGVMIVSIFKKPRIWSRNNRCARKVWNYFNRGEHTILEAIEVSKIQRHFKWQLILVKPRQ